MKRCGNRILVAAVVAWTAGTMLAAENPVSAAVVPGADVLVRLDVAGLMEAPIVKAMEAANTDRDPTGEVMEKLMKTHLGLEKGDVRSFVGSAVLAPLFMHEGPTEPDWAAIPVAASMIFAKPVTMAGVQAFLTAAQAEAQAGTYEVVSIAGRQAVRFLTPSAKQTPLYLALSDTGQAAYLAMSPAAMEQTLARAGGQQSTSLSPALLSLRSSLPEGVQLSYLFQASDAIRKKIQADSAATAANEAAAMNPMAGMGALFQNLQSVGLGVAAAEALDIHLFSDLGGAQQAQQAAMLLKNMLLPMLQMQLAGITKPGDPVIDANSLVSVNHAGSMLKIKLVMDRKMIDSIQAMSKATMAEPTEFDLSESME